MTTRITSAEYESAATIRCAHSWDHRKRLPNTPSEFPD